MKIIKIENCNKCYWFHNQGEVLKNKIWRIACSNNKHPLYNQKKKRTLTFDIASPNAIEPIFNKCPLEDLNE